MKKKLISLDSSRRLAARVPRLALFTGLLSISLVAACVVNVFIGLHARERRISLPDVSRQQVADVRPAAPDLVKPAQRQSCGVCAQQPQLHAAIHPSPSAATQAPQMSLSKPDNRALAIGFYVNWDDSSYSALKRALPKLDWVIPTWLSVSGPDMALHAAIDVNALQLIRTRKPATPILPLLQNAVDGVWDGQGLARMLHDPATRQARIADIVAFLAAYDFQGVTIDFEGVPTSAHPALKSFLSELKQAFRPHGWGIVLSVPFDDADWDYAGYAKLANFELLMAYDQHWAGKQAGSIAAKGWFEQTLAKRMRLLDPDQTIIALGSYGYDWASGSIAKPLTFQDAMRRAAYTQADISFDADTQNPHYSYNDHAGVAHQVWFLDGVTAYNQIHAADHYKPYAYAIWRLGAEDPSIWPLLGRAYGAASSSQLSSIGQSHGIDIEDQEGAPYVASESSPGMRVIEIDKRDGSIRHESYTRLPVSYAMTRPLTLPRKIAAVGEHQIVVRDVVMLRKFQSIQVRPEG